MENKIFYPFVQKKRKSFSFFLEFLARNHGIEIRVESKLVICRYYYGTQPVRHVYSKWLCQALSVEVTAKNVQMLSSSKYFSENIYNPKFYHAILQTNSLLTLSTVLGFLFYFKFPYFILKTIFVGTSIRTDWKDLRRYYNFHV